MSDTSNFDFGKFIPGFDFLQSLTQGAGAAANPLGKTPQWVAPTVNIDEVDKRITELKAVQFWLEQNSRALAATIQALEVQRMTLSTLQGMNVSMSELAKSFSFPAMGAASERPQHDLGRTNVFAQAMDWTRAAAASAQDFSRWVKPQPSAEEQAAAPAEHTSDPAVMQAQAGLFKAAAAQDSTAQPQPPEAPAASSDEPADHSTADAAREVSEEMAAVQKAAVGQAMQWWGALTEQFKQIAAKAVAEPVSQQAMEAAQRAGDMASHLAKTAVQTATEATEKILASGTQAVTKASASVPAKAGAKTDAKAQAKSSQTGASAGKSAAQSAGKKAGAKPASQRAAATAQAVAKAPAQPVAPAGAKATRATKASAATKKTAKAVKTVSTGRARAKG